MALSRRSPTPTATTSPITDCTPRCSSHASMNDSCPPGWPILPNVPHPIGFLPLPPPTAGQSTTSATKPALLHEHHSSLHTTNLTQNYGSAEPSPLAPHGPPLGSPDDPADPKPVWHPCCLL